MTSTLVLLACSATLPAHAADQAGSSATELVQAIKASRVSDGFEIRLTVRTLASGSSDGLTRLALIGQTSEGRDRLLVRALSPSQLRDRAILSERVDGRVRSLAYGPDATSPATTVDPTARIFGSDLIVWDLMAPWWNWSEQTTAGTQTVGGHTCTEVRSRPDQREVSVVREVVSCIDARTDIAWKTEMFDGHHRLLRSIRVTRDVRTQAGTSAARSATITGADGSVTLVDVYSGDDRHQILPDTFDTPAGPAPARD